MKECVDEGAVFVASGGVDDEAGGFVDDEQIGVFVEDFERDVLGEDFGGDRFWEGEGNGVAQFECGARLAGFAIEQRVAGADEILDAGAGELWEFGV